jgi:predicted glycogen debranching enzyme
MKQLPQPGDYLLKWRGDSIEVQLRLPSPRKGRAFLRTDIGSASVLRREVIDETEKGVVPRAEGWSDIPLDEVSPGVFSKKIQLDEIGVFSGKTCFFPEGSSIPLWPHGSDFRVKVQSSQTRSCNSIYTVFPRQFGSFRAVVRNLGHIMDDMGFRIIQTLPPFPVPTTYAVMGEYGCPFAATDFFSVDPAMAEFDARTTPLDQFEELVGAVHARGGLFFIDLPANHTGWGSTLQLHHPEWFKRGKDGRFISPGAWGVVWEDLVELDYSHSGLCSYMAQVFLHWCRKGVDGFRCDAGYMIPSRVWAYIVAKVREEYPETVFMLEGLGGDIAVTDDLLSKAGLDWAYSELFQTYDRGAFEWYLPNAAGRASQYGSLVHFAETHDNDRLAKNGEVWARLRVMLASLLSWQGSWGITNGVEYFATEKIDVHGKNDLNWGASHNMVGLISRLNSILRHESVFTGESSLSVITRGDGNVLAVLRTKCASSQMPERKILVLANLDCGVSSSVDWDRGQFPFAKAFDYVSEREVDLSGNVTLMPGEVMCLAPTPSPAIEETRDSFQNEEALYHIDLGADTTRNVVIPAGQTVEVVDSSPFRFCVVDPLSGCTLYVFRSYDGKGRFVVPPYEGDGFSCRVLKIEVSRYRDGVSSRISFTLSVPPEWERAAVALAVDGARIRRDNNLRTVLSDGSGAAAQIRLAWGCIKSQYDALLAANPNPEVPSDRINIWTRMRCWLQRDGYVMPVDEKCITRFYADPSGHSARWEFTVPCGTGGEASFVFTHSLVPNANTAILSVERVKGSSADVDGEVRLVFRPDLEWRVSHSTTKAYLGPEKEFASSARVLADGKGVVFAPGEGSFTLSLEGGEYHHEPEWAYNIAHEEEGERGLESSGDLFSPGWISADLISGKSLTVRGSYLRPGEKSKESVRALPFQSRQSLPLEKALKEAMELYIVKRNDLKTVIAGYPWFLDWGRDTFIFMRGMIAAEMISESIEILRAFAAFEERGTLPNIIYGTTAGNRDTTDAQLWFIRCVQEAEKHGAARKDIEKLRKTCASIVDNYILGTPNSIHIDEESALVWSPSHFTWMDTNYPACTPRAGYPVEIQALWISALKYLGRDELAEKALSSLKKYFKTDLGYCDCLDAPDGRPASAATRDEAIRPNQLFLLTLGVVNDASILRATETLLVPAGIRSLSSGHQLYRGVYTGDEDTSRKRAYHNGTAWMWQFPLYAEALFEAHSSEAASALSLLASAVDNINSGCLCHLSEIADGDAPHAQKGCAAQAWSVSELLRVYLKIRRGV